MRSSLPGRGDVVALVKDLLTRRERDGVLLSQRQPILIVGGGHGTGKTALMQHLVRRISRTPTSFIDLESDVVIADELTTREVLAGIAFQLSRHSAQYGSMRFPRLAIGQVAATVKIDTSDRSSAKHAIAAALQRRRGVDTAVEVLEGVAGELAKQMQHIQHDVAIAAPVISPAIRSVASFATRSKLGRRGVLGRHQAWYGQAAANAKSDDSLDTLVDLADWTMHPDTWDNRQRADELWWRAFLTDITDNFRHGRHCEEWTLNCAVVLDNVDSILGQTLLRTLADVRHELLRLDGRNIDPLTIIATSRGPLLEEIVKPGLERIATEKDWRLDPVAPWLKVMLRELSPDDVRALLPSGLNSQQSNRSLATTVYRLTQGQPAATEAILQAFPHANETADLDAVLRTSQNHKTVEEDIVERLLPHLPITIVGDLATLAAAPTEHYAAKLAASSKMLMNSDVFPRQVPPGFWPTTQRAQPTVLQSLLLRRLARRPQGGGRGEPPSWRTVFNWLREAARTAGDANMSLRLSLSLGDFTNVVEALTDDLVDLTGAEWLDRLHVTVSAPWPPDTSDQENDGTQWSREARRTPEQLATQLVRESAPNGELHSVVANLLASLWTVSAPLTGEPRDILHWRVANCYQELHRFLHDVPNELRALQQEHERLARK